MDLKSLKNVFSRRINDLQLSLNYSTKKMGLCLKASPTSYLRYVQGKTLPGFPGLFSIAEKLGVSLDWLVCGKGPIYYKEKEIPVPPIPAVEIMEQKPDVIADEKPVIENTGLAVEKTAEKTVEKEEDNADKKALERMNILQEFLPGLSRDDLNDFLVLMRRIPLLRHEVLAFFYQFIEEHKDLVSQAVTKQE